jgi:hypothetical protein
MSQTTNDNNDDDDAWATWETEWLEKKEKVVNGHILVEPDIPNVNGKFRIVEPEIPRDEFLENLKQRLKKNAYKYNENAENEYVTDEVIEKVDIEELIAYLKELFNPTPEYCTYNERHLKMSVKDITPWCKMIEREFIGEKTDINIEKCEEIGYATFIAFRETHHDNIHKYNTQLPDDIYHLNVVYRIEEEDYND